MALYLGILLFSFVITAILIIPFIDFLFRLQLVHRSKFSKDESVEKLGTPIGGGVLLVVIICALFSFLYPILSRLGLYITSLYPIKEELNVIFFTFISFALVGLYDDIAKIFSFKPAKFLGLNVGIKTAVQVILSFIVSQLLYSNLAISIINIPFFGVLDLGWWFVPFSALIILFFTRGFDVADGLDGLASGVLLICLLAFWSISFSYLDTAISVFIALWIGSLIAFLYFNVYPARIWLGNSGSLAFGSTLAVVGLLLGKTGALLVVGGFFIISAVVQGLQLISIRVFNRKLLPTSPIHYLLLKKWPEPKVVMRLWIISAIFAVLGLWLA